MPRFWITFWVRISLCVFIYIVKYIMSHLQCKLTTIDLRIKEITCYLIRLFLGYLYWGLSLYTKVYHSVCIHHILNKAWIKCFVISRKYLWKKLHIIFYQYSPSCIQFIVFTIYEIYNQLYSNIMFKYI